MSRLPLELYDFIIQSLREDRDALKALSLSFRELTAPSQRHFFAHVIIQPPWQCVREYHNVSGAASAFRQLLDTSPHIGEYVKSLEVSDRTFYSLINLQRCDIHQAKSGGWIHEDEDLPSCLTRLTSLQALVMDYTPLSKPVSEVLLFAVYKVVHLPSLVYLELGDDPAMSVMSVVQHSSKNLKHLVINPHGGDISLTRNPKAPDDIVALHSLCLKECAGFRVEPLLESRSRVSLKGLKRLAACVVDYHENYEALAKILQACQRSLEELLLKWQYICDADLESSFYLNNLTSLKRFHIFFMSGSAMVREAEAGVVDMPWFSHFLKQSRMDDHPLEELSVEQFLACDEHDDDGEKEDMLSDLRDDWRKIVDILLNKQHFPRLQSFKLRIYSDVPGLPCAAVELLESSDFFQQMKSQLASFSIIGRVHGHCIMADFVPDHTWLSMEDPSRHELKKSHIPAT